MIRLATQPEPAFDMQCDFGDMGSRMMIKLVDEPGTTANRPGPKEIKNLRQKRFRKWRSVGTGIQNRMGHAQA